MRKMRLRTALMGLVVASCAAPAPERSGNASELLGRTPGTPQQCVSLRSTEPLLLSETDRHTLLYGSGRIIFANRLGECSFGRDDILVTEPSGSYYCRGDLVRSFDRTSHIPGRSCVLGDFVPYSR